MIAEIEKYVDKIQKKVFISVTTPHHIVNSIPNWTSTKICSYSCILLYRWEMSSCNTLVYTLYTCYHKRTRTRVQVY